MIAAPTSAGKTLVGELLAVPNGDRGAVVFLVSRKALARQIYSVFQTRYLVDEIPYVKVGIATGDEDLVRGEWGEFDVVVSTYEKLYSALVTNTGLIEQLGCIVADELQLLGDVSRGATAELLIARLLYAGSVAVPSRSVIAS